MHQSDLLYYIALSLLKHVGPANGKKLIGLFGSAEAVFNEGPGMMRKYNIHNRIAEQLRDPGVLRKAEKELKFIEKKSIKAISIEDAFFISEFLVSCLDFIG